MPGIPPLDGGRPPRARRFFIAGPKSAPYNEERFPLPDFDGPGSSVSPAKIKKRDIARGSLFVVRKPRQRLVNRRYLLEAQLGEGGMGEVYRARDQLRGGRLIALKLLSPERSRQENRDGLRAEFYTLTRLHHPNLVAVHDLGVDGETGRWFLTLEYVAGQTLADWKPGQRPGLVDLAVPLLRGLDFIHQRGFVHADIKPENILLPAGGGEPKIVDFGLAGVLGRAGTLRGSIPYTAPEVFRGDPPGVSSDLYSLGASLYHAAAGRSPFDAPDPETIIEGHLRLNPPFPEELTRSWPRGFSTILRHLLAKDPASRPVSGAEVIAAINDLSGTRFQVETGATQTATIKRGTLVGRASELALVDTILSRLHGEEHGGAVILTGAAGIGKTRLVGEIRVRAQMEGLTVAGGTCCGAGGGDPLMAATDVLSDLLPLASTPPGDVLSRLLPGLPGAPDGASPDRALLMEAAAGLVRDVSSTLPLVLTFEDLQHANEDLLDLVTYLLRSTAQKPVLVVLTGREDDAAEPFQHFLAEMRDEPGATAMVLPPLNREEAGTLVASFLGGGTLGEAAVDFLHQETRGNPYLLGETVQALLDGKALERAPGAGWQLDLHRATRQRLPEAVGAAALRRVDNLPDDAVALLEIFAVAGGELDEPALSRLAQKPSGETARGLALLLERQMVTRTNAPGRLLSYRFAHAFFRDALYHRMGAVDSKRRAALHQSVAQDLAAHAGERIDNLAAELATHFEAASRPEEAAGFHLRAARRQQRRFALRAAAHHYRRALDLLQGAGEAPARLAEIWEMLGDLHRSGYYPEAADRAFQQALALDVPGRSDRSRALLLWKRGTTLNSAGDFASARGLLVQAQELYEKTNDRAGIGACENALGVSSARRGDHVQAEAHYRRALALRRTLESPADTAMSLVNLGTVVCFQGRADEGRKLMEEALDLVRADGDDANIALVLNNLGSILTDQGRLEPAQAHLQEAEKIYERLGAVRHRAQCLVNLGRVAIRTGAFHHAARQAALGAEIYRRLGMHSEIASCQEVEGDAYRESGRVEAALEAHERGLARSRRAGDNSQVTFALCSLALDHLAAGETRASRAVMEKASAPPGSRSGRRLLRVRARTALALGDGKQALQQARDLLDRTNGETDQVETIEVQLLHTRALIILGRFKEALLQLEGLLAPEMRAAYPARSWELLRLKAHCLDGAGRPQEAHRVAEEAVEAFARLVSALPPEFRAPLEASPAAVRLRVASGGSETARVAPSRILDTMHHVIEALTSLRDTEAMLQQVMDLALELLGAERGLILLFPEDGSKPRVAACRNVEEQTIADAITYSCTVVDQGRLGRSLASADARQDPRLKDFASVSQLQIRSILCVPMQARERVIGTVYLDSRSRIIGFDEDDLHFLEAFAQHAATTLDNSRMLRALERENLTLRRALLERYSFAHIVGRTPVMQEVFATLRSIKTSSLPVLVLGESGTGKELVARALHFNGLRKNGPFLTENCAAFPEQLLESQLFGHARGAFTGAARQQRGLFLEANGGTLFLDEIGEMSAGLQARLTRVLETGEVRPVGRSQPVRVDVRIIAATHRDLDEMTREGQFRHDLLFRLNVITIELPPLRERKDDIPLLVSHFLEELAQENGTSIPGIEDSALELLCARDWPGNVRQLRNEISRLTVFRQGKVITAEDVRLIAPEGVPVAPDRAEPPEDVISLKEMEKRHILRALEETSGDRTRAARLLRVGRATVFRKIKDYGLDV